MRKIDIEAVRERVRRETMREQKRVKTVFRQQGNS